MYIYIIVYIGAIEVNLTILNSPFNSGHYDVMSME